MRKARTGRLPARLPEPVPAPAPATRSGRRHRADHPDDRLGKGRSAFGPAELFAIARRVAQRDPRALLGAPPAPTTLDEVITAWRDVWGWDAAASAPARIDVTRSRAAAVAAVARMDEVARGGGRIAFATAAPAALLGTHVTLAARARALGASVVTDRVGGSFHDRGRRALSVTWVAGVATATDGDDLVTSVGGEAAEEWRFRVPFVDLVVADGAFAGRAMTDGCETVAFADLDAVAFACCAPRVNSHVVPVPTRAPAGDYEPFLAGVLEALESIAASPAPLDNSESPS
ncbi:MAG: phosphatase [Acidimicrobiia bacterium]